MMSTDFEWKRFWCPRDKNFDLSDRGFLSDPETEWGKLANPNLVTFQDMTVTPCVALLGEPGIGKSRDLARQILSSHKSEPGGNTKLLRLDLRSFGSEDRLINSLFMSEQFRQWQDSDYVLHLYLDSLDECLLRIDNVGSLLADELRNHPVERLKLRIVCRTLAWPAVLERALVGLFGDEGFAAYELVPLRRVDVTLAAGKSGISDPNAFFQTIDNLAVTSFAIKPVTLKFLINTYLREGNLPTNQLELYEKGCRVLCEEPNESRQSAGRSGWSTPEQRLEIASRIAAVTQLTNKYAVWTGSEASEVPEEDVLLADLIGGSEYGSDEFVVSSSFIRETLDTGLFSSRGQHRIGWAHQTYAEFLSARYCKRRELPPQQMQALIFHPAYDHNRLVPQMHEVAAWISVTIPEMLKIVAKSDPEALLGAAGASLSCKQRQLIVSSILNLTDSGRPVHLRWGMYSLYHKLQNPELATELRIYLIDKTKNLGARRVALDIGRACEVTDLSSEFATISLDPTEDIALRIPAAAAAAALGSAEVRMRLRPLAFEQAGDDPDDELKGAGLTALWPDLISATDLFPLLTERKNSNLYGLYTSFLFYDLVSKMKPSDLPFALQWFCKEPNRTNVSGAMDRVMNDIVWLAWENMDAPEVASALTSAVVSRAEFYDHLVGPQERGKFDKELASNDGRRRMLLTQLLPRLATIPSNGIYTATQFIARKDFEWIIQRVTSGQNESSAAFEAKLLPRLVDSSDTVQMDYLWHACQSNELIASECKELFGPFDLNSETAKILRDSCATQQSRATPALLSPTPSELIQRDLKNIEANQVAEWWLQLTLDLSLEPTSTHYRNDLEPRLTSLPGWNTAENGTKTRIVRAARLYIDVVDPHNHEWGGTSQIPFVALGGFRALELLREVAPEMLDTLTVEQWNKWVPSLLRFPANQGESRTLKAHLLQQAYLYVPDEVIRSFICEIDRDNEQNGYLLIALEIEAIFDEKIGTALLTKLTDPQLKSPVFSELLRLLIKRNMPGATERAKSYVVEPVPGDKAQQSRMLAAVQVLIEEVPDASWAKAWPAIVNNANFGKRVVESASYGNLGRSAFIGKLTESQLGQLYLWMVQNYPYVQHTGLTAGALGPVDTAVMLRDSILEHLKNRATFAACEAIRDVIGKLPQYPWLNYHLDEAESLARAATWNPISSRQLLTLVFDHDKRLIQNGQELIDVVVESLDRLNSKLHSELSPVKYLWNTSGGGLRPRDEEDLSDYVALHLDEDLRQRAVVVNREVQIRRGPRRGSGQSTDIHVDTVVPGGKSGTYERMYAIIEVKGNWHNELLSAMRTQLRDRYLKDNRCRNGIYLVGWFSSPDWDEKDYRKRTKSPMHFHEARDVFEEQAAGLSTGGYNIQSYVLDLRST